jgi:ATP-dependent DNA helicase RecG
MSTRSTLDNSVQFLPGVGPARAADFARLNVHTIRDLLFTFPRDVSDRSNFSTIADAKIGEDIALIVRPVDAREKKARGGRLTLTVVRFADDTGEMEAIWFNSPWIMDKFQGGNVMLFGKAKFDFGILKMEHPQHELIDADLPDNVLHIGRIVPLYPCTGKLTQQVWRKVMMSAIEKFLPELPEIYPADFLQNRGFPFRQKAVRDMHFPPDAGAREQAFARLVFDECLLMQLAISLSRRRYVEELPGRSFRITPEIDSRIRSLFPFRLTAAQNKCVKEISDDMREERPMHRLLQGDVGSGKTVVALYAMLAAVANKAQVCIMAPTGLLARQHFETIEKFLGNSSHSKVKTGLLVGGMKKDERDGIINRLASGALDILIATHSAIQKDVKFYDLGVVVIDEQHKFGVRQRATLAEKGTRPDVLVMTATPIPRSLALTVYGDLDVSTIDELPPGRKPVKTSLPDKTREADMWKFIRRELTKGRQAFVISPLVEESETLDLKSATEAYEQLMAGELSGFRLALLHGRMKREEQQEIMDAFRAGAVDVLVSTVVIEVGVDIPNANVMVVLHAERFGLAQLHQLRGRIGRGDEQGHFILLSDAKGDEARRRLSTLVHTADGFKVAEEDLSIRGPGEFLGTKQHGLPDLKLVDIVRDLATIREARKIADKIVKIDPVLQQPSHLTLREELVLLLGKEGAEIGIG